MSTPLATTVVPVDVRLDSWKEIAAHLDRSVRTTQRWAIREGLPVHHVHGRLSGVYAWKSELDEWWEGRQDSPQPVVAAEAGAASRSVEWSGRKIAVTLAASSLVLALALASSPAPFGSPGLHPIHLVVLPFENLSGRPEQDFLADAISEDLITRLSSAAPRILVIPRSSVNRFKGSRKGVREIGRELRVEYVLAGGARRSDDHLRVTAQLVRVGDERPLWAERYDRGTRDILAAETEVVERIVQELGTSLALPEPQGPVAALPALPQSCPGVTLPLQTDGHDHGSSEIRPRPAP